MKNLKFRIVGTKTQGNKTVELVRETYDNGEYMLRTKYYIDGRFVDQTCYFHEDHDPMTYDELVEQNEYLLERKLNRFVDRRQGLYFQFLYRF